MKKLNWLFALLFVLAFTACDDDDNDVTLDTTAPVITITSPTANASYAAGAQVPFKATVTDNEGLDKLTVSVTDAGGTVRQVDDQKIRDFLNDNTKKDLELNIGLDANAAAGSYTIIVTATDKQGNNASQSIGFTVM
ncbi:DUF4625 domain-containing protein [Pontibacter liquoris]|uniref:DUF4625 domain-containing protein n=1 Tax=Pontibacter liquoris TaxID=2905677 RepID=UPI001FA7AE68|nr:DUF4625 domain-containing protein [Pontibacter liquoris]